MRSLARSFATATALTTLLAADAEQLPIKSYTTADGLVQNTIHRIVRDSHGFLWFCTSEGLSRFDGYTFTNYGTEHGLPHRMVTDILEARSAYWVGTYNGLVRFDPKETKFTAIEPSEPISAVREGRSGTIWVGTSRGVDRVECSGARCDLQPVDVGIRDQNRDVEDLIEDRRGDLWAATSNGLYRRSKGGAVERFTEENGMPVRFFQTLFEDSRGELWAGSREAGFFRLDTSDASHPRVAEQIIYRSASGEVTTWIYQIIETSDGTLWAATNRGIVQVSRGQPLRAFGTRNGLTHHEITAIAEDSARNLWLGTSSAGAMKLARDGFVTYSEREGILGVNAIFGDRDGGVYFRGYVLGPPDPTRPFDLYFLRFGKLDGEKITWILPNLDEKTLGWVGERVTLRARSGEWWIGTANCVVRFPSVPFEQLTMTRPIASYPTSQVFRLFEDSRGDIWISTIEATANSLSRWNHMVDAIQILNNVSAGALARSFGEDASGNIWIGVDNGVVRYRDGRSVFFALPSGAVNDILLDRASRLWLATSSAGVLRIDKPNEPRPVFQRYTTREGLSSNLALVLTEDASGGIYVGTGRALDRLDPSTGRMRHFTTADGPAAGSFLGAFCDRKGRIWLGTEKGLTRYSPEREAASRPPEIVVSGVAIAGSRKRVSAIGERALVLPQLAPDNNHLQFDVVALNFALGQSLRYQYKLESGRAAEWSLPTEQRTINYANLSPDTYKFSVRAVNSDGQVSPVPATVSFTILPYLWQRWWFLSLAAGWIAVIAYAAYRYRVKRLIEVANIRTSIAADLHDDIGANLTRIAILSEVARQQLGTSSEEGPLSSIARISRESVSAMSDIVWAINPERDSVIDLLRRMRRHAEEVFAANGMKLAFTTTPAADDLKLGSVLRRDLFLIFKEAVNNAARHSSGTRVDIDLRVENQALFLQVEDNGTGFDPDHESVGQGLISMRRRAQKIGASLEIDSRAGRGTTVRLRVPYRGSSWFSLPERVGDTSRTKA